MDGDRTADGGTKSVQVADSEGTALCLAVDVVAVRVVACAGHRVRVGAVLVRVRHGAGVRDIRHDGRGGLRHRLEPREHQRRQRHTGDL
jgi:hypothetical protein